MRIIFKNAVNSTEILQLKSAKADVILINYHGTLCFNMTVGIPSALRAAREISLYTGASILLHAKLDIEGDNFLSTLVIKNAELIGVSDCISNDMYTQGGALRLYKIADTQAGVIIDKDMLYSGADNLFYAGAKIVFHNTLRNFDKEFFGAYKSHIRLTNGFYIGLFADCAIIGDKTVKILERCAEYETDIPAREYVTSKAFLKLSRG